MWTHENRPKYNWDHLRYPSDLTDDEWAHVEPLIPPAKPGGGKRRTDMRAVMNGVMYKQARWSTWRVSSNSVLTAAARLLASTATSPTRVSRRFRLARPVCRERQLEREPTHALVGGCDASMRGPAQQLPLSS
jgi:hypothetical protein